MLLAEAHKAEASLALGVAALPALAHAAVATGVCEARAKGSLDAMPGVRAAADELECSFAWALEQRA